MDGPIHGAFMSRDLKSHDVCTVCFTYIDTNSMHKHIAPSIGYFHTLCTVHRACKGVFAEHGEATQQLTQRGREATEGRRRHPCAAALTVAARRQAQP